MPKNSETTFDQVDWHNPNQQALQWNLLLSGTSITRMPRPASEGGGFHPAKGFLSASLNTTAGSADFNTFKLFFDKTRVGFTSQFPSDVKVDLHTSATFVQPAGNLSLQRIRYQLTGAEPFIQVGLVSSSYSTVSSGSFVTPGFNIMTGSVMVFGPRRTSR